MLFSIVILSFNKLPVTRQCITRVITSTDFTSPSELIVVDNGSTDGSVEWMQTTLRTLCASKGLSLKLIVNDHNVGCSTARNQALSMSEGEYVTFLDNDVEPAARNWLTNLHSRMESNPSIGMVGGLLLYPPTADDEYVDSALIQCAGVGISQRGHVCFCGRGETLAGSRYTSPREVQCLISACMMIRRSLYAEYGGFDEVFNPVQFEDFDICYLYRSHGWHAWYEPSAVMYHHESTTTAGSPSIRNAAVVVRNGLKFQKKWSHIFSHENGPAEEECKWKKL